MTRTDKKDVACTCSSTAYRCFLKTLLRDGGFSEVACNVHCNEILQAIPSMLALPPSGNLCKKSVNRMVLLGNLEK